MQNNSSAKKLTFRKRDFLYDNGLVNLLLIYDDLDNKGELKFDGEIKLSDTQIEIIASEKSIRQLLKQIYTFYARNLFSFHPKNKRLYWDKTKKQVVEYKKVNFVGASKQEMKHKYIYEKLEDLVDSEGNLLALKAMSEEIRKNLNNYSGTIKTDNETKEIVHINNLVSKTGNVNVLKTKDEYIEKEVRKRVDVKSKKRLCDTCRQNYATGETSLLTQPFDGGLRGTNNFEDFLNTTSNNVCVWCDLIYQLGTRMLRFFSETDKKIYYYFHSYSLQNLYDIKKELHINNDRVTLIVNPKADPPTPKQGTSNFHQIEDKDSKFKDYNIWTYGDQDKLLKLLLGLYLEFIDKKQSTKEEYDFDIFKGSSIISFEEKNIKNNLESYSELKKLFRLFQKLQDPKNTIKTKTVEKLSLLDLLAKKGSIGNFDCLLSLSAQGANVNREDSDKVLYQDFVESFLSFRPLHNYYFQFQFNLFTLQNMDEKKQQSILPESLKDFEDHYIRLTQGDDSEDLLIHKLCYIVGREIGRFLGKTENKDLIFVLRAVNNKEQLVEFLRDFRFKQLKEDKEEENDFKFSKDFYPSFDALLNIIANNKKIFLVRDYLALYVISGYSTGQFYKNKKEKED